MAVEPRFRAGRPRDPELEGRVLGAAVRVFAEHGWAGFTFAAVAREAGVGRSALYLRWDTPEHLAIAALEAHIITADSLDTGSFRSDLILLASSLLQTYAGEAGLAPLRIFTESPGASELLRELRERIAETRMAAARAAVQRGIDRGEVDSDADVDLVAEMIAGAVINHALLTAHSRLPKTLAQQDAFAARVVDMLVRGIAPVERS